ncbi:MAG: hypothetical protein WB771_06855 [Solirubrobacterales bacterium]
MSDDSTRIRLSRRGAAAVAAALVLLAIAASGCGSDLKNAVDSARSVQNQASNALTQAQQQAQSVQNQAQQDQGGGGQSGY